MRRRGHEVIYRGGTRRNIKSPPPSLAQPDTVRACEVTCSQLLFPQSPTGTRRNACWTFRGPGPPTSGKGAGLLAAGLSGCLAGAPLLHYTALQHLLYHHHCRRVGVVVIVCSVWGWREGSLITCPRPGGPVNVTSFLPPVCVVDFVASDSGLAQAGVLLVRSLGP